MPKVLIDVKTKGAGKASKKIGGLNKSLGGLAVKAGAAAGAFFGAKALISGFQKSIDLSGRFQKLAPAFNNLAKSAGFSEQAFKKFDTALNGTVGSLGLMEQANNAMLLGIVENEDQMAKLFDTGQRLASALGKDARFGVESLVTGLGRQSKLMLDNLGIMVDVASANENYAHSIGKTVDQLTDEERKQAFVNTALKEADKLVSKLGDEKLTTADRTDQLKKATSDLAISIGGIFAPAMDKATTKMTGFTKKLNETLEFAKTIDWGATTKNFIDNWQVFGNLFLADLKTIIDFIPDFLKLAWNKLVPIAKGIFEKLSNFVKATAKFIFEPYVIAGEILWNKLKIVFQKIGASMVNSIVENGLNPILQRMKNFASAFPKMAKKMGIDQIELIKPIDMDAVGSDLIAKNKALAKELENTPYMKLVNEILTTDDVQDFGGLLDQLKQNRVDAANELIALNAVVLKDKDNSNLLNQERERQYLDNMNAMNNEFVSQEFLRQQKLDEKDAAKKAKQKAYFDGIGKSFTDFFKNKKSMADKDLTEDMKRAAMQSGSAADSAKAVVKAEAMEAMAGLISSIFKSVAYPFNLILAAVAGATVNKVIDKGLSNIKGVKGAATGADFVTSGPQMLMVGENAGGKERVQVTPLSSPNIDGPQGGNPITLNISGNVMTEEFTEDQVLPALREALRRGGNLDHNHGPMGIRKPEWSF